MRDYKAEKNEFVQCWMVTLIALILLLCVAYLERCIDFNEPVNFMINHSEIK